MGDSNPEELVPQQSPGGILKSLFFILLKICFFMIILSSQFLGAFPKWRKAAISFVMSVRVEQLGTHWTDFHEIRCLNILRKAVKKIQV